MNQVQVKQASNFMVVVVMNIDGVTAAADQSELAAMIH